ncbi:PLP-dependent aminotransferase family protein [Bacillus sp. JCM 19041]|uniref:MocR-like pyridoxine biosynthesis transcription factor PdxR n=1 Tax=Bacillus sp. JCM 19041 TaxID=1460637 RepID=UPI0006D0EB05
MLWFSLSRQSTKTLVQQIEEELRQKIFSGNLKRTPKTAVIKRVSSSLGVSRNTVNEAYEQLLLEGYIYQVPRSGTYVSQGLAFRKGMGSVPNHQEYKEESQQQQNVIDFKASHPSTEHFPRHSWGNLFKQVCMESEDHLFGYQSAKGAFTLRKEIANYLGRMRGVRADPRQIVITAGATQALSLLTRLLAKNGDVVCVEDPVTDEMRQIFSYADANIYPVHADQHGMRPELLPQIDKPRFVFTIPSHQFPLGVIMPVKRRIQLVEYARKLGTYIVEDDYDSEFIYEGTPVQAMQALDPDRVIYVGTFSKILVPSIRIGYMVLPFHLVEASEKAKWFTDRHSSTLEQLTLAKFIEKGLFEKHIRRMKKVYAKRRNVLVSAIEEAFGENCIIGHSAGMHLVVRFHGKMDQERLEEHGVRAAFVEDFAIKKGLHQNELVLGYGGLDESEIIEGVARLKRASGVKVEGS